MDGLDGVVDERDVDERDGRDVDEFDDAVDVLDGAV